jgi:hypothetical protein
MLNQLYTMYQNVLTQKGYEIINIPQQKITVQGGIGTAAEDQFLIHHYQLDGTGWGSPFLLVPEVTAVDSNTLKSLSDATEADFYISSSSPLGIPFNNFRGSSSEKQRLARIAAGKPGNPCTKKYLVSNTEFTKQPICTASNKYQKLKIDELKKLNLNTKDFETKYQEVTSKICLCEGLVNSFYIKNNILEPKENSAVAICPGPNLAYFNGNYSLKEMVDHIYGKQNLLENVTRPHLFINELKLYISYLKTDIENSLNQRDQKKEKYLHNFSSQLVLGINYYKSLCENHHFINNVDITSFKKDLVALEQSLQKLVLENLSAKAQELKV